MFRKIRIRFLETMTATWLQTMQQLRALYETEGVVDACGRQAPENLLPRSQTQTPLLESSEVEFLPYAAWRWLHPELLRDWLWVGPLFSHTVVKGSV